MISYVPVIYTYIYIYYKYTAGFWLVSGVQGELGEVEGYGACPETAVPIVCLFVLFGDG